MKDLTIEQINNVPHTVVWYDYSIFEIHPWNDSKYAIHLRDGTYIALDDCGNHIGTALPPLHRNLSALNTENNREQQCAAVRIMQLYRAHGLEIYLRGEWRGVDGFGYTLKEPEKFLGVYADEYDFEWETDGFARLVWEVQIAYVTNDNGELINVALID